jgi:hypothetical protein
LSELVNDVFALVRAAGDADHACAADLADLPGDGTDRAGSGGDHQRFARLHRCDVGQAVISGDAAHAAGAEQGRQRDARVGGQAHVALGVFVQHQIVLPTGNALHQIAFAVFGRARCDHTAQTERAHHLADGHRRQVLRDVAHPHAVGRIHRQVQHANQHLAFFQLGHRLFDEVEIIALHEPFRAGFQAKLAIDRGHGLAF